MNAMTGGSAIKKYDLFYKKYLRNDINNKR